MKKIHAFDLAEQGLTGEGVTVAVIDSGLYAGHEDLDYSRIETGWDYMRGAEMTEEELADSTGHGTAMIGILQASRGNGIGLAGLLGGADIVPLRVDLTDADQVAAAVADAAEKYKAQVILIGGGCAGSESLQKSVNAAEEAGVLLISAADANGIYPAAYGSVISAGALDRDGEVMDDTRPDSSPDVYAPAQDMVTLAEGKTQYLVSTDASYASAVIAAMAAAAKQTDRTVTREELLKLFEMTAQQSDPEIVDCAAFASAAGGSVTLDPSTAFLYTGSRLTLQADYSANASSDFEETYKWSCSDNTKVSVSASGKSAVVTGLSDGEVTVTVLGEKTQKTASCSITVRTYVSPSVVTPQADEPEDEKPGGEAQNDPSAGEAGQGDVIQNGDVIENEGESSLDFVITSTGTEAEQEQKEAEVPTVSVSSQERPP